MQKKLFISHILMMCVAVGVASLVFWLYGYQNIKNNTHDYYLMQAKMIADSFDSEDMISESESMRFVEFWAKEYGMRITLIASDGSVFMDSAKKVPMENHGDRQEVKGALNGESVSLTRFSTTMGQEYSYSAVPVKNTMFEGVMRISIPVTEFRNLDRSVTQSILVSVVICLVIAFAIAAVFSKKLSYPIDEITDAAKRVTEGDYSVKLYTEDKGQIGKLFRSFNIMTRNQKISVQKLTNRNIELEAMLNSMTNAVVAIDSTNSVLFHNSAFVDLIQHKSKNLQQKSLYNIVRNALIFEVIDRVRASDSSYVSEGTFDINEGKSIRVTGAPLSVIDGKVLGILLIIDDITQVKKLETMRSDFVSNVTHELKTPLTSIRGFIDTLKNGAISDEAVAKKFLDIIDIEAERLYTLIQDILLLSEIESKREYTRISCNISFCIQEVIELLKPKLNETVELVYAPKSEIKDIICNPDRIKQLLINLLDNAIKYTEEGIITIECREEDEELILIICDTGIGIEEQYLARIFERFYRIDKGRSRKQGGTGLGLSIVKHIVELYNGTIKVTSAIHEGSVFEIRLPYR